MICFTGRLFLAGTMPYSLQVGLFLIKKRDYAVPLNLRPHMYEAHLPLNLTGSPKMLPTTRN